MNLKKIRWKNFNSYGAEETKLVLDGKSSLTLLTGQNGSGKCVHSDTIIDIKFKNKKLEKMFIEFLKKI